MHIVSNVVLHPSYSGRLLTGLPGLYFVQLDPACYAVVVGGYCVDSLHCEARRVLQAGSHKVGKQLLNCGFCNCCGECEHFFLPFLIQYVSLH